MKRLFRITLILVLFIIVVNVAMNAWLSYHAHTSMYYDIDKLPINTYGLVLGTVKKDENGKVYESYSNRLKTAIQLYKAGKLKYLLVSSTNNRRYSYNATTMKADLVKYGIPSHNILVDTNGLRTLNSILECKNTFGITQVTIISQARHCRRALYIDRHYGLTAIAFPASSGNTDTYIGSIFHEQVARFVMLYDLFISGVK